jgi:hypothetical protein
VGIAEYEGAVESAIDTARDLLGKCHDDLAVLPDNESTMALHQIARFLGALLEKCRR